MKRASLTLLRSPQSPQRAQLAARASRSRSAIVWNQSSAAPSDVRCSRSASSRQFRWPWTYSGNYKIPSTEYFVPHNDNDCAGNATAEGSRRQLSDWFTARARVAALPHPSSAEQLL